MARVLVVDDNKLTAITTKKVLVKSGHKVDGVLRHKKAFELLNERVYDVIFLDYNIPDGTGCEFLEKFNKLDLEHRPSICMMSGVISPNVILECIELGAKDYLSKPVDSARLCNKTLELTGIPISKRLAKIDVISADIKLTDKRILPEIEVRWISELQVNLISSAELTVGEALKFHIPYFKNKLEMDAENFVLKISDCIKHRLGYYECICEFLGIHENDLKKIRAIAVKGEKIYEEKVKEVS